MVKETIRVIVIENDNLMPNIYITEQGKIYKKSSDFIKELCKPHENKYEIRCTFYDCEETNPALFNITEIKDEISFDYLANFDTVWYEARDDF